MLGEDSAAPVYWTSDEIGRYINDAYSEACLDTKALEFIEGVVLTSGSEVASLSYYVSSILRVTFDDRKLENITKRELDRSDTDWEALSGTVSHYVTSLESHNAISTYKAWDGTESYGYNLFFDDGLYVYTRWALSTVYAVDARATHDLATATGNRVAYCCILFHTASATTEPGVGATWESYWVPIALMVWAVKNPYKMVLSADEPELPPWCHIALAYSAASKALMKYGEQRNEAAAKVYAALAEEYWVMLRAIVSNRTPERLVAMSSGSPRKHSVRPYPWPPAVTVS